MGGDDQGTAYGFDDDTLAGLDTVFRPDLFAGRTVIVSGAGSGLGKAIAMLFARLGADLAICGRDEDRLEKARVLFARQGHAVFARTCNIRDHEAVGGFMDAVWSECGPADVLVNNAGGQFPQLALDFKPKGWNAVIDTNLNGTWYMMQAAARRWVDAKRAGSVVNIVADVWRGMPGAAHTCAARAGVIYLSKTVAVEWAPEGIRVNCVAPGCCETPAFAYYPPQGAATFAQANPMRRHGDAWDVAQACAWLAAPSGKFVTGEVVTVDGGQQLWGDPWLCGRPDYFKL